MNPPKVSAKNPSKFFFTNSLLIILLGLATAHFGLFLVSSYSKIFFRYSWNYGEPVIAAAIFNIPSKPFIYQPLTAEPLTILAYNPLYVYLSYLVSLFAVPIFAAGRIVSMASFLGLGIVLYHFLRTGGTARKLAAALVLLAAAVPIFSKYSGLMKVDMAALFFSVAGVYFLFRREKEGRKSLDKDFWLAIFSFSISFFIKQISIAGPAAAFIYLLFHRRFKEARFFLIAHAAIAVVVIALLNFATKGAYFQNVVIFNQQPFYWGLFLISWKTYLPDLWPFYVLPVLIILGRLKKEKFGLTEIYFVLSILLTVLAAKIGSDDNYFLESSFIGYMICCTIFFDTAISFLKPIFIKIIFLTVLLSSLSKNIAAFEWPARATLRETAMLDEVSSLVGHIKGPILAENMGILIALKKPILFEPFEYTQLAYRHMIDETPFLARLKRQEYPLILMNTNPYAIEKSQRFTPAFVETLLINYKVYGVLKGHIFMIPRSSPIKPVAFRNS